MPRDYVKVLQVSQYISRGVAETDSQLEPASTEVKKSPRRPHTTGGLR